MEKVLIERYEDDKEALGCVRAESGRWELIVDKENVPHLYVQCDVEADDGQTVKGMFCVEDMLPEGWSIADLMHEGSRFEGRCSPEDEAAAAEEWRVRHEKIPCPTMGVKRGKAKAA